MKNKIIEKEFNSDLLNLYFEIKDKCLKKYEDLTIVNNVFLIFQKLFENKQKKGNYVECGVFKGGTLIPAVPFSEETEIEFNLGKLLISIDNKNSIHMKGPVSDID